MQQAFDMSSTNGKRIVSSLSVELVRFAGPEIEMNDSANPFQMIKCWCDIHIGRFPHYIVMNPGHYTTLFV